MFLASVEPKSSTILVLWECAGDADCSVQHLQALAPIARKDNVSWLSFLKVFLEQLTEFCSTKICLPCPNCSPHWPTWQAILCASCVFFALCALVVKSETGQTHGPFGSGSKSTRSFAQDTDLFISVFRQVLSCSSFFRHMLSYFSWSSDKCCGKPAAFRQVVVLQYQSSDMCCRTVASNESTASTVSTALT